MTNSFPSECAHSAQCAPYKHHYDECVERVLRQEEDEDFKGTKEDCVEECKFNMISTLPELDLHAPDLMIRAHELTIFLVFHLTHCATACAAPKLWRELK